MTMLSDFSFGLKLPMFWLSLFKGHRTKKVNNAKYRLLQLQMIYTCYMYRYALSSLRKCIFQNLFFPLFIISKYENPTLENEQVVSTLSTTFALCSCNILYFYRLMLFCDVTLVQHSANCL